MDAALQVKMVHLDEFEIRYCIICQKKDEKGLVSNPNGRTKLMDAAHICKDVVWGCRQSIGADKPFKYHMDNKCCKKYVLKKSLEGR